MLTPINISTISELQSAVDSLIPLMLEKGLHRPNARAQLEANGGGGVSLSWQWREVKSSDPWDDKNFATRWFFASTNVRADGLGSWPGAIRDAWLELSAMPDKPAREREEFLKLLATASEYGRKVGIDEEFVNPLALLAKKLSENALTHDGYTSAHSAERITLRVSDEARKRIEETPARQMPALDDDILF